jgi:nucleoredoxin
MESLFGGVLYACDKSVGMCAESATSEALRGKRYVGVYFSAHWCGPCKAFTPKLVEWYAANSADIEIVFASSDRNQAAFDSYFAEMPWQVYSICSLPDNAYGPAG